MRKQILLMLCLGAVPIAAAQQSTPLVTHGQVGDCDARWRGCD